MELKIKNEYLDSVILFQRRQIQLRFLERELYQSVYNFAPEYFEVIEEDLEMKEMVKNARKWSDIFEETPLFKKYVKN